MPVPRLVTRAATPLLVGVVVAAALLLTRPSAAVPTEAVVTSAAAAEVCVEAAEGPMCLDAEHVDHLRLTRFHEGDCVTVRYAARWVPGTVTEFEPSSCRG